MQNKNRVPRTTASFESMIEIARAEAQKVSFKWIMRLKGMPSLGD